MLDVDLRKGYLHQYFGISREKGVSEVVSGVYELGEVVRQGVVENVDFIPTGTLPPNPSELLLHENMSKLLQSLSERYDYVLLDTPPVLAVSDTLILSAQASAIFVVARAGLSTLGEIQETVKRYTQAGIQVKGVVFNGLKRRPGGYGYKYGNKYRYTQYKY
jgi:tyrosine-protein kinase Etk/Wzc